MRRKRLCSLNSTTSTCSLTLYLLFSSSLSFSFCVAMFLERHQIYVARRTARLLPLMTLRMNMRPSEGNALQSVPALPANDHNHLRCNHERSITHCCGTT